MARPLALWLSLAALTSLAGGCGTPSASCTLAGVGRWNGAGSPIGSFRDVLIYFTFGDSGTVKYEFGTAEDTLGYQFDGKLLTFTDDSSCAASGQDQPGVYKVDFHDCKEFGLMVSSDPCKGRQSVFNGTVLVRP